MGPPSTLVCSWIALAPFDKEKGRGYIRSTIAVLESLDLPKEDMEKICYRNAETMFGLRKG